MNGGKGHRRRPPNDSHSVEYGQGSVIAGATSSSSQSPWLDEVDAVIADISTCVASAVLSEILTSKDLHATCAYFNVETLESRRVCVKLSVDGFSIVGNDFDDKSLELRDGDHETIKVFETPYSLLQSISPLYGNKFASQLYEKLSALSKQP